MDKQIKAFYATANVEKYDPAQPQICVVKVTTFDDVLLLALVNEEQEGDFVRRLREEGLTPCKVNGPGVGTIKDLTVHKSGVIM